MGRVWGGHVVGVGRAWGGRGAGVGQVRGGCVAGADSPVERHARHDADDFRPKHGVPVRDLQRLLGPVHLMHNGLQFPVRHDFVESHASSVHVHPLRVREDEGEEDGQGGTVSWSCTTAAGRVGRRTAVVRARARGSRYGRVAGSGPVCSSRRTDRRAPWMAVGDTPRPPAPPRCCARRRRGRRCRYR